MEKYLVWAEKYRPKTFDDLVLINKDKIKTKLEKELKEFPNLLLYSQSGGTGKGSIFNVIKHHLNTDTKEVNASRDNGIDFIRNVIENFVTTKSLTGGKRKLLFLDEVDGMSKSGFDALKGIMEKNTHNCIFILSTNRIEKIPQPIKSRCGVMIDLKQPDKNLILERLKYICDKESVDIEEQALKKIISMKYPDIRSMINILQDLSYNDKITYDLVMTKEEPSKILYQMILDKKSLDYARKYWLENNINLEQALLDIWKYYWLNKTNNENIENIVKLFAISNDLIGKGNQDIQFAYFYSQIVRLIRN